MGAHLGKIWRDHQLLEQRETIVRLVRDIRIEVLLLPGAMLKQKKERKLVTGFSSGTIPERTRKILVVISFQDSSNLSIWDELNFENSRHTTVSVSQIAGKFTKGKCDM